MSKRTSIPPQADDFEALHDLLCEVRLLADLTVSMRPQTLTVESEHLATTLTSFADRLEVAIRMIPESTCVTRASQAMHRR